MGCRGVKRIKELVFVGSFVQHKQSGFPIGKDRLETDNGRAIQKIPVVFEVFFIITQRRHKIVFIKVGNDC